jgi:hypothetical protein
MKKVYFLLFLSVFQVFIFSCTPKTLSEEVNNPQACCGEEAQIPPPPPDGSNG